MIPETAPHPAQPARLDVVLCWHMHQPDYRLNDTWQRPWTWLHAIKDYTDMVAHLERVPGARAVVNFSPVLLLQIEELARRLDGACEDGAAVGDPLLDALAGRNPADESALQHALLRAHEQNMAGRFAPYRLLAERAAAALAAGTVLPLQARDDLLCWYVLCWLGESVREDARAVALQQRAEGFGAAERRQLLELVADHIGNLLPRYRALAEAGTVELSVTPYSHPILPLLLDFRVAAEAMPGVALPREAYPGGEARCDWQVDEAIRVFRGTFGRAPRGCWPSEGGLSTATLDVLDRHGFAWTASGSRVLHNSLAADTSWPQLDAWRPPGAQGPVCFFRDDGLSDRIGFVYASWEPHDAVADFVRHVEQVRAHAPRGRQAVLSIIMDGENAWEYYRGNGWEFLQGLYRELAAHPALNLTTFSAALDRVQPQTLPDFTAGSWVHGTFSTWIGAPARNRAWSLLVEAKRAIDTALGVARDNGMGDPAWRARVRRQLAVCEASDWFWWLEEGNPHPDVADFEALFRAQLKSLYRIAGAAPPARLDEPLVFRPGHSPLPGQAAESTMRRSGNAGGDADEVSP